MTAFYVCPCCNRTLAHEPPCDKFKAHRRRRFVAGVLFWLVVLSVGYIFYAENCGAPRDYKDPLAVERAP